MTADLDGCQVVLDATDAVTDEEAELLCLFPGDLDIDVDVLAAQWRLLFGNAEPTDEEMAGYGYGDPVVMGYRPRRIRRALARLVGRGTLDYDRLLAELRAQGLDVVEVAGARTRGSFPFSPRGHLRHHTAGSPSGDIPSLRILIQGRSDLPGPLCHVGTARSNRVYLVAVGRANHAGSGGMYGLSGNGSVTGDECENVGTTAEPWRPDQEVTQAKVAAAFQRAVEGDPGLVADHKTWTPRKPDAHSLSTVRLRELTRRFFEQPGGDVDTLGPEDREVLASLRRDARATAEVLG